MNKKKEFKKFIPLLILFLLIILVLLSLIIINNYNKIKMISNETNIRNQFNYNNINNIVSKKFKSIFTYDINNKDILYYDFSNLINNHNFESLRIELKKRFPNYSPLGDFFINNNNFENYKLNKSLNNNTYYNNSLVKQLINISLNDPFYFYMNNKVHFIQAYYYISSEKSLYKNELNEDSFIVRYIFIMNSSLIRNNDPNIFSKNLVLKYNNLVKYSQKVNLKFYIFILDFPEELFQRIFYDQGGLR